jgi:hypothetical protein
MNLLSEVVDFTKVEDQLVSRWLHACNQQFLALAGGSWESAARAWAELARETPVTARQDVAVFWQLAGAASEKARNATRRAR